MKRGLLVLLFFHLATLFSVSATRSYTELSQWTNDDLRRKALDYVDRLGEPDSALLCFNIIVSRNEMSKSEADSHLTASSLMQMGYIYMAFLLDYDRAFSCLYRSQEICQRKHYYDVLPSVYINLGILSYLESNIFLGKSYDTKAMDYYHKALRISLDRHLSNTTSLSFLNMASIAIMSGKESSVLSEARQVKAACRNMRISNSDYLIRVISGIENLSSGRYSQAEKDFAVSPLTLKAYNKIDRARYAITSLGFAAVACQKDGRYDDAISHLKQAMRLAVDNHLTDEIMDIYNLLAQNYSLSGQPAVAKNYRYRYLEAKDDFITSSHLHHVSQEKFEHEMNANNTILKASLLRQRHMEMALLLALAVSIVIATLLYVTYRMYRKQKSYAETVYRKNVELMGLESKKYISSGLDEGVKRELQQRIGKIMDDIEVISLPNFSLQQLAEKTESNSRYVSQVINECYGCNFKALLNDRRVKEACRRMSDKEHYGNLTIDAIATSVGFRSRSNFLNVFKKIIGLSPSEFQRYSKEQKASVQDRGSFSD